MYRPLRSTGIPSLAHRCATATGCPRKCAIAGQPVRMGEAGSITGTPPRCFVGPVREADRLFGGVLAGFFGAFLLDMILGDRL